MTSVHVVPALAPDDQQHQWSAVCWCQPQIERGPWAEAVVVIHRRYMDGPVIETTDEHRPMWDVVIGA